MICVTKTRSSPETFNIVSWLPEYLAKSDVPSLQSRIVTDLVAEPPSLPRSRILSEELPSHLEWILGICPCKAI